MLHQQVFLLCNQVSLSFWPPVSWQPCAVGVVSLSHLFSFFTLSLTQEWKRHLLHQSPHQLQVSLHLSALHGEHPFCAAASINARTYATREQHSAPTQFSVLILKDANRVSIKPTFRSCPSRPALGGLLSSSYRQHQESLAAERQRRRVEREERLQRIEREERNKHRCGLSFLGRPFEVEEVHEMKKMPVQQFVVVEK